MPRSRLAVPSVGLMAKRPNAGTIAAPLSRLMLDCFDAVCEAASIPLTLLPWPCRASLIRAYFPRMRTAMLVALAPEEALAQPGAPRRRPGVADALIFYA